MVTENDIRKRLRRVIYWPQDPERNCWLWIGAGGSERFYGTVSIASKTRSAHRLMWQICYGDIPDGLFVLHKCDNRKCVNPKHLWLGTAKDNALDASKKGRLKNNFRVFYGDLNSQSKLKNVDIVKIRLMANKYSQTNIAKKFRVSQATVWKILNGKSWKHI